MLGLSKLTRVRSGQAVTNNSKMKVGFWLIFLGASLGLVILWPKQTYAYFTEAVVSQKLLVSAGDWQSPALSFLIQKSSGQEIPIEEYIQNPNFIFNNNNLGSWQTDNCDKQASEFGLLLKTNGTKPCLLSQNINSSSHTRWLTINYQNLSPLDCRYSQVLAYLSLNQKVYWYETTPACGIGDETKGSQHTAVVKIPSEAGNLQFFLMPDVLSEQNHQIELGLLSGLTAAVRTQDNILIQTSEKISNNWNSHLTFNQLGIQKYSFTPKDLAGNVGLSYNLYLDWLDVSFNLPQLLPTWQNDGELLFSLNQVSQCWELANSQINQIHLLLPFLELDPNLVKVACPMGFPLLGKISTSQDINESKWVWTDMTGNELTVPYLSI